MVDQPKTFNPNEHMLQLKSREGSKSYLPVQWRLVWFRELCPGGDIDTQELEYDLDREVEAEIYVWNAEKKRSEKTIKKARGYARYRAVVTDGKGGRATGTKSENAANFSDFGEKAETGAIGRALAALGYGTQFVGQDLDEGHRIVDAPVERVGQAIVRPPSASATTASQPADETSKATEQQIMSIHKLCQHLSKPEMELDGLTMVDAKAMIADLSQEYRKLREAERQHGTSGK